MLLSVSGVGASTARMILSSINPDELEKVIVTEDVNSLKSVKGIGLKSAQRIIIDLKDKISINTSLISGEITSNKSIVKQETLYALEKLGFPIKKTIKIVESITYENPNLSVEEVIKMALKKSVKFVFISLKNIRCTIFLMVIFYHGIVLSQNDSISGSQNNLSGLGLTENHIDSVQYDSDI